MGFDKDEEIRNAVLKQEGDVNKDELEKQLESETGVKLSDVPLVLEHNVPRDGYYRVPKDILPFSKNYPDHIQFDIRSATVNEIKHWSTLDDTSKDPRHLMNHFNYMIEKCVRVVGGRWDDIKETDRFWFVAYLHEITFVDTERPTPVKSICKSNACDGNEWTSNLSKDILVYDIPDKKYMKYWNPQTATFDIQTSKYGTVTINPPTLKTANALLAYASEAKPQWVKDNATFFEVAPYLVPVGVTPTSKVFETIYLKYKSWQTAEFSFMITLVNALKVKQKEHFVVRCPKCGTNTDQDFDLEGGIRSLFLPVSNLDNELL